MAEDKKLSQLDSLAPVLGTDVVYIVRGTGFYKTTVADIVALASGGGGGAATWGGIGGALEDQADLAAVLDALTVAVAAKADSAHGHAMADITGLAAALAGKAAATHSHAISDVTGLQTSLDGKAAATHTHNASALDAGNLGAARNSLLTYRAVAGTSDTLQLADAFLGVDYQSASATGLLIPTNTAVAYPVGTVIHGYVSGTGQVTIAGDTGVTVRTRGGALKSAGQYARWTMEKKAADEWIVTGDLTT